MTKSTRAATKKTNGKTKEQLPGLVIDQTVLKEKSTNLRPESDREGTYKVTNNRNSGENHVVVISRYTKAFKNLEEAGQEKETDQDTYMQLSDPLSHEPPNDMEAWPSRGSRVST